MPRLRCLLLPIGLFLSPAVKADVIKCSFTEPFMTTLYDTSSKRMTLTYDVQKRRAVLDRVAMQETARGVFEFRSTNGQLVQRLKRTCRGSDGMSDRRYPYEAELIAEKLYGGCASTDTTGCQTQPRPRPAASKLVPGDCSLQA